jgi:hypothetical protein
MRGSQLPLIRKIFIMDSAIAEKPQELPMFVCHEQLDEGFAPLHHQRGTVCLASSGRLSVAQSGGQEEEWRGAWLSRKMSSVSSDFSWPLAS